jgi:hypothetical protein
MRSANASATSSATTSPWIDPAEHGGYSTAARRTPTLVLEDIITGNLRWYR